MASSKPSDVEEFIFAIALQKVLAHEINIQVDELQEVTNRYLRGQKPKRVYKQLSVNTDGAGEGDILETEKSKQEWAAFEHINNLFSEGKVRFQRAFLLLSAPQNEEDVITRKEEYISFLSRYKGVKENPDLNPYEIVHITNFDQAKTEMVRFLTGKGNECILPQIIFNGYGTDTGQLKIGEEYVPNDTFISAIETLSREHWKPNEQSDMKIILAHCYSHAVSFSPIAPIHVVSLSTVASPNTYRTKTITTINSKVTKVTHNNEILNELAETLSKAHLSGDSTMGLVNEQVKLRSDTSLRVVSDMDLDQ